MRTQILMVEKSKYPIITPRHSVDALPYFEMAKGKYPDAYTDSLSPKLLSCLGATLRSSEPTSFLRYSGLTLEKQSL